MLMRTLSHSAAAALLLLCCACSSRAFQPAQEIIHVNSASTAAQNTILRVKVQVQVEAPGDPRVPDLNGNLYYPDQESARIYERWLRAGIREDARMADFIRFSGAVDYTWWKEGGGLSLTLNGSPDMTRLALRWGKHFPDVVKDLALSTPVYSRTVSSPIGTDPYNAPANYYPYGNTYNGTQYNNQYNGNQYNGYYDPYNAYCPTCGLARLDCRCPNNCCGNQVSPKPVVTGGVDTAGGPYIRQKPTAQKPGTVHGKSTAR